jgi:hypothetical protein
MSALAAAVLAMAWAATCAPAAGPPAIEKVEVRNRALVVNGRPMIPLMAWLQDSKNWPAVKAAGMNTVAGFWAGSSGAKSPREFQDLLWRDGLYGVMPSHAGLVGHPGLLAYIHDDEPDLPRQVSDATVDPKAGMRLNTSTPLWKLVDGVTHSWSVLDPLQDAAVTITLARPVTVVRLAVHQTVSPGLSMAKEVRFEGDGKPLLTAQLKAEKGQQAFDLPAPATFRALRLTVTAVTAGDKEFGSLGEVEGFDAAGRNVLLSPPRTEPRATPEQTLEAYRKMKATDPSRPVFMTLTAYFMPEFSKWSDDRREALYAAYMPAADVVGFDVYPIYGWNKPEWLHRVAEGTARLAALAGERPVYAWIETGKGGQWTGPLEKQKDVTPAHIRAEVWMALCNGATAIGYFTHVWKPAYDQFGVPEENRKALADTNAQVTRLTDALLGDPPPRPVTMTVEGDARVDMLARACGRNIYVFAVNGDGAMKAARCTFKMDGLADGATVEVVDEGRTIKAAGGAFADAFEPLAVHVYRIAGVN